jgi:hypothetical protein
VKLSAREDRAGKKVVCPRCKGKIQISDPSEPQPSTSEAQNDLQLIDPPKPLDGALLELKDEQASANIDEGQREEQLQSSILPESPPERTGERKLPWPIDILLYPFSGAGLTTLGIVIVIPLLINLVAGALGPFGFFIAIPGAIVNAVIDAYFLWYVTQCVQDSGLGGVRAPETISQAPGLWDMVVQLGRTLACIAVALLPLMVYWSCVQKVDITYWSLLGFAAAVFPMAMLSVTMHDSIGGLNPLILIPSVFRTLLSYLVLVLALGSVVFLLVRIWLAVTEDPALSFTFSLAKYYPILVAAHLLGRFYWRYREKLDWLV